MVDEWGRGPGDRSRKSGFRAAGEQGRSQLPRRVGAILAALCLGSLLATGCTSAPSDQPPGKTATRVNVDPGLASRAVSAAVNGYVDPMRAVSLHSLGALLVTVDGRTVFERYYRGTAAQTYDVHSVTKSVLGTLIGIALADGSLRSLDQTLGELLPRYQPAMSRAMRAVTLRQVLTMTGGLPADPLSAAGDADPPFLRTPNWVPAIVRAGLEKPADTGFAYSSAGSHLLSAILVQATGQPVLQYARRSLFDPLGIDTRPAAEPLAIAANARVYERAAFAWPVDRQGNHTGFGLLKITPRNMARLGQLYLDRGRWRGTQVVPAEWVADATASHVPPAETTGEGGGAAQGYGYQWWVTTIPGAGPAFYAKGLGGQLIEVVPRLRLVTVIASAFDDTESGVDDPTQFVPDVIAPALLHVATASPSQ